MPIPTMDLPLHPVHTGMTTTVTEAGFTNRRPSMWIPLAILAALSLGGGYINIPQFLDADVRRAA